VAQKFRATAGGYAKCEARPSGFGRASATKRARYPLVRRSTASRS